MKYLTVTLNPAVDKIIKVEGFEPGGDFRASEVAEYAGGKGINVSRALCILGEKSLATGLVAGRNGAFIEKQLKEEGIPFKFYHSGGETRVNHTIIDSAKKRTTRILEKGPALSLADFGKCKKFITGLPVKCGYAVFSGSLPQDMPDNAYGILIESANRKKIRTVLDTSGEALVYGIEAKPCMLKMNREEAEAILGKKLDSIDEIVSGLKKLIKKGIEIIIISLGEEGAVAADSEYIVHAVPPVMRPVNTVGSGDSMVAGFLYSYTKSGDFFKSVQFAVAAGTANITNYKPGHINKKQLLNIMKKVEIRDYWRI